jgi:hypothetical protein
MENHWITVNARIKLLIALKSNLAEQFSLHVNMEEKTFAIKLANIKELMEDFDFTINCLSNL